MTKLKCKECGKSTKLKRTRHRKRTNDIVRYYECQTCNHTFQTIEKIYDGWNYKNKYDELAEKIKKLAEKL